MRIVVFVAVCLLISEHDCLAYSIPYDPIGVIAGHKTINDVDWKKEFRTSYSLRREERRVHAQQHQQLYQDHSRLMHPFRPQPTYPYPPSIVGGDHDRGLFVPCQPSPFAFPSTGPRQPFFPGGVPQPRPRFDPFGPLPEHQYNFGSRGNRRGPGTGGWGGNTLL